MSGVVVEREIPTVWFPSPSNPKILCNQRARLGCGCAVFVGVRLDTGDGDPEVCTAAWPCCRTHKVSILVRFNEAMAATLPSESTEPLIDVVARVLAAAE